MTNPSRFLLYKDYQSGISNEVLSVELAVGLAHLTGRTLIYYGSVGEDRTVAPIPNILARSPPSRRHIVDNSRTPTILDLLDNLPVATANFAQFRDLAAGRKLPVHESGLRLVSAVFLDRGAEEDRDAIAEFTGNRPTFSDRNEDIVHLKEANLGYFSRIFYSPRPSLYATMNRVTARKPYQGLADSVCAKLGRFNGVHVRLNDFNKFLPYRGLDYPREVLRNLAANLPDDELLVISTDEADNTEFFAPIVGHFRNHVFVDDLIAREFGKEFRALPFSDEVALAWMSNLILRGAKEFLGTPGSTFSGLIHRHVALAQAKNDLFSSPQAFKFTYPGSATIDVPFEDGMYLETRPARFSWNRLGWNMEEETKSWYREWPEAIPTQVRDAPNVSERPAAKPRPFTAVTSFKGPGVPPQLTAQPQTAPGRRAIERQMQTIACDLMFGADRASLIQRVMALGAPAAEAKRIIETAYDDPLIANGRAMALVLRKRDWLLEAMERQQRLWPMADAIERKSGIGASEFLERYYSRGRPVILAGEMSGWRAIKTWTPAHLASYAGDLDVDCQVELARSRAGAPAGGAKRMPFAQFIEYALRHEAGNGGYVLADSATHNPALAKRLGTDCGTLDAFLGTGTAQPGGTLWIGSSNLLTPLHHDLVNCLVAQIAGRNRFKIVAAGQVDKLYNHLHVLSEIKDLGAPDFDIARYPGLAGARIQEVTLEPGEILYLPLAWWYQVRSLGFGASVTYTNFKWPNDFFRDYPTR